VIAGDESLRTNTLEEFWQVFTLIIEQYKKYLASIYVKYAPVEKGERLFVDDFIIIGADLFWELLQSNLGRDEGELYLSP
jgi:hypothetical protein